MVYKDSLGPILFTSRNTMKDRMEVFVYGCVDV